MKIMAKDSSATVRQQAPQLTHIPYGNEPTRTNTIFSALRRRAEAVLNDKSIDPHSRAIIRYALETSDPWLAELVLRADAGESLVETVDFTQEPQARNDDDFEVEKIEALAEMICRGGDEPDTKSAALLVLMATFEDSPHPKALANATKHLAFNYCA